MRVLVTRPKEDANALIAALAARGFETLVEPMLTVLPAPGITGPLDLDAVQALLFTSANGVRALARLTERRDLPVFTVGDASAEVATAAGFAAVVSADGDVDDLARLAIDRLTPADGTLYQAAASRRAGDLKAALEAAGFTLRREVLYETVPATDFSANLRRELAAGGVAAATFFSPRTAETFAGLIEKLGLSGPCAGITALCLSEAVAAQLRKLNWRAMLIAELPTQDSLLDRLGELAASPSEASTPESDGMTPSQNVIAQFGGIRPMAGKLGVAVSTVQGWRERGAIPPRHHDRVREAARAVGIHIAPAALASDQGAVQEQATERPPQPEPKPELKPKSELNPKLEPKADPKPAPKPRTAAPISPKSAPPPEDAAPGQGQGQSRSWLAGALLGALLLVGGAGGAFIARDFWMPLAGPEYAAGDDGALKSIERRIASLESAETQRPEGLGPDALTPLANSLQALQARIDTLAAGAADDDTAAAARRAELSERLDRLDGRLDELAAQAQDQAAQGRTALDEARQRLEELAARPDPAPEIAMLTQQVAELAAARAATEATANSNAALSLAVLQLREALQGSGPFAAEIGLLADLAASSALAEGPEVAALIAPLADHAETGIPSLVRLKADFPAVARAALIAARGGAGDGWWAGVVRRLSDLVILRPVGEVDAQNKSPGAVLARAETRIRANDPSAALDELTALQGPASEAVREWREAAGARAAARHALVGLGRVLAARLQAAGG
jgi:uroporphyrinogen-III synthase